MYQRTKKRALWGRNSSPIEESFYSKKTRERLVEEEALTNEEAGFMQGYEDLFEESLSEDFKGSV